MQPLVNNALRLEARYSLANDMATAYVVISQQYITPGIEKLDDLTTGSAAAAATKLSDFRQWENNSVQGISRMVMQVSTQISPSLVLRRILY